jgi:hypothetical protein
LAPRLHRPALARPAPRGSTGRLGLHRHRQRPAYRAPPARTWSTRELSTASPAPPARTLMELLLRRPALARSAPRGSTGRLGLHRHRQRPAHCALPARTGSTRVSRELSTASPAPPARTLMVLAPRLRRPALARSAPQGSTGRLGLHRHRQRPAHCALRARELSTASPAPPARTLMELLLRRPALARPAPRGSTGGLGLHPHRQRPA